MAQEETENSFPIQIRHNTDGWFFLPKEYNKEGNAWLYECPSCQAQIIISPLISEPTEPEIESLSDTQLQPQQGLSEVSQTEESQAVEPSEKPKSTRGRSPSRSPETG